MTGYTRWLRVEVTAASMHETPGGGGALAQASPLKLALTGMLFGLIHVLTGPDHLSALATLSAGSSWRSFALGIRWGCGHSIGLILMAIIFISVDGKLDFSVLNVVTDVLVGVFMVGLGLYGVHEGLKNARSRRRELHEAKLHKNGAVELPQTDSDDDDTAPEETASGSTYLHSSRHSVITNDEQLQLDDINSSSDEETTVHTQGEEDCSVPLSPHSPTRRKRKPLARCKRNLQEESTQEDEDLCEEHKPTVGAISPATAHQQQHDLTEIQISPMDSLVSTDEFLTRNGRRHSVTSSDEDNDSSDSMRSVDDSEDTVRCCGQTYRLPPWMQIDFKSARTQKCTALLVGIVHGIAGPGGILGVLPAVGLHDTAKSFLYLGSFCLTSIATMGIFAAIYGEATGRLGERSELMAFRISIFSSMLSVIVGVLWLVLAAAGKLQQVFG